MSHRGNIVELAKLSGHEEQKQQILKDLGDLEQYDVLDDECLIAIYAESNVLSSGVDVAGNKFEIVSTENQATESQYQGKVGLLVKIGPTAFKYHNNGQAYEGTNPKVGDWVVTHASDGREIWLRDANAPKGTAWVTCRRLKWPGIFMRVVDPRIVRKSIAMHDPREIISYIDAFGVEKSKLLQQCRDVIDAQYKLLSRWRAVGKALSFGAHNGEVADYDDEIASELVRLHKDTVAATEFPC